MNLSDLSATFRPFEDETIEDLGRNGLRILQKQHGFRYGTDAVLLSDFALIHRRDRVADFGTGTGIVSLLLVGRHPDIHVDAIELQSEMADMAARSAEMNGLTDCVKVHHADIRDALTLLGTNSMDAVVCNPPYYKSGASLLPEDENKRTSRMDTAITIGEICLSANKVLKSGGRMSAVFPAARALELMSAMEQNRLAPKRIRTVHGTVNHAPKLVLIDAVKDGGDQLMWLPPLILSKEDGSPTEEYKKIYGE